MSGTPVRSEEDLNDINRAYEPKTELGRFIRDKLFEMHRANFARAASDDGMPDNLSVDAKQNLMAMRRQEEFRKSVPQALRNATLENFECDGKFADKKRAIIKRLSGYIDSIGLIQEINNHIFYGSIGTGKDHLMVSCLSRLCSIGHTCKIISGVEIYREILDKIEVHGEEGKRSTLLKKYLSPKVLAISDPILPAGDGSAFYINWLFDIVSQRYDNKKSTWISININKPDDLFTVFSKPMADRLRFGSVLIECRWESYRGAVAK